MYVSNNFSEGVCITCGIYCIANKINQKKYVGQALNIEKRFSQHQHALKNNKHHNQHLQKAYNKYGSDNFDFFILKRCKHQYLDRFEKLYIRQHNSIKQGYNITYGYQDRQSIYQEQRLKMSRATTTTGIYGVSKRNRPDLQQGFIYVYKTQACTITSVDLLRLQQKIQNKGLDWIIIDNDKAQATYEENKQLRE